jgi:hypothetical protein
MALEDAEAPVPLFGTTLPFDDFSEFAAGFVMLVVGAIAAAVSWAIAREASDSIVGRVTSVVPFADSEGGGIPGV